MHKRPNVQSLDHRTNFRRSPTSQSPRHSLISLNPNIIKTQMYTTSVGPSTPGRIYAA